MDAFKDMMFERNIDAGRLFVVENAVPETQDSSPVKFFMEWTSPVKKLSSTYMRLRVSSGMVT